jgi:hypothetical protein
LQYSLEQKSKVPFVELDRNRYASGMQPNANVNNVPMDLVTGFRIEGKFAMSIFWGSAAIILRALRDKTKNQPVEIAKISAV